MHSNADKQSGTESNDRGSFFLLLVAIQFLTRLPVSKNLNPTKEEFGACAPYFPAVGFIVGGILAVIALVLLSLPLAPGIVVVLLMIFGVLLTGGFHEDGLADTIDGMGGGWTKEDVLRIMKDSRVGSYGVLGVALLLLVRASALWGMEIAFWPQALIVAHVISRWSILPLMKTMPYARTDSPGLGKPIVDRISPNGFAASTIGVIVLCLLIEGPALLSMGLAAILAFALGRYFQKRIDGITGDCLGAVNIVCELTVLITYAFVHGATVSPWVAR